MDTTLISRNDIKKLTLDQLRPYVNKELVIAGGRKNKNGISHKKIVPGFKCIEWHPDEARFISNDGTLEVEVIKPIQPFPADCTKYEAWILRLTNNQTGEAITDHDILDNFADRAYDFMKS